MESAQQGSNGASGQTSSPAAPTNPGTPMTTQAHASQFLFFAICLFGFGTVITLGGIIASAMGFIAGYVMLPIGLLLIIGGCVLAVFAMRKRAQAQAEFSQHKSQVVTGYTPVVGGGLAPPPGQQGSSSPPYNPHYPQPSDSLQSGYPGSGNAPPPSYGSVAGVTSEEKVPLSEY